MKLTRSELALVRALTEGPADTVALCEALNCSREAVRKHIANIRAKLPVGGVGQVMAYTLTPDAKAACEWAVERLSPRARAA